MEDDERFQELKEKEIIRLTTPLTYVKEKWHKPPSVYDCEGNIIERDCGKYILEPNPEILSHDEILMYAPRSKEASRIRLSKAKVHFLININYMENKPFSAQVFRLCFVGLQFFHYGYFFY